MRVKAKGDVPSGPIKRTEKKGDVKNLAKKGIKPIVEWEVGPKAGPSKQLPVSETQYMNDVMINRGNDKKEPAKRQKKAEEGDEGPVKKKKKGVKDGTAVIERSKDSVVDMERLEMVKTAKGSRNSPPPSSKSKPKKTKASDPVSNSSAPLPLDVDPSRLAELQGMVIESFTVSRASALPASALYRSITDNRPSLKTERSQEEWMELIEAVLEEGQSNSGVFGKVESSFKDDSDRALEAKWFYVPERDVDQERATLISSMMPRAAKRTETKKYKQYYYQPLDKISRWDPEDDL